MTRDMICLRGCLKKTAIEEMLHVEKLADRILFLKGDVDMKLAQETQKITSVKDMLELARKMEEESAKNIIAGQMNAHRTPMQFQNSYSKVLLQTRNAITTSMITSLKISQSSV